MDGEDKVITCRTCETPFVFSAGEQEFFALKGLKNIPVRCPNCRTSLKLFKKGKAAGMMPPGDRPVPSPIRHLGAREGVARLTRATTDPKGRESSP